MFIIYVDVHVDYLSYIYNIIPDFIDIIDFEWRLNQWMRPIITLGTNALTSCSLLIAFLLTDVISLIYSSWGQTPLTHTHTRYQLTISVETDILWYPSSVSPEPSLWGALSLVFFPLHPLLFFQCDQLAPWEAQKQQLGKVKSIQVSTQDGCFSLNKMFSKAS